MQDEGNPFGNAYKVKLKDLSKYKQTVDQIKKIKGVPIAGFDMERQLPYIEYADGRREYEK